MKRRVFNFVTLASLFLCIGVLGLWARSYWAIDRLTCEGTADGMETNFHILQSGTGAMTYIYARRPTTDPVTYRWRRDVWQPSGRTLIGLLHALVVFKGENSVLGSLALTVITVPLWVPMALFGILPAVRMFLLWRRRRLSPGTCPVCGYDLRATPDRCPECGTAAGMAA